MMKSINGTTASIGTWLFALSSTEPLLAGLIQDDPRRCSVPSACGRFTGCTDRESGPPPHPPFL